MERTFRFWHKNWWEWKSMASSAAAREEREEVVREHRRSLFLGVATLVLTIILAAILNTHQTDQIQTVVVGRIDEVSRHLDVQAQRWEDLSSRVQKLEINLELLQKYIGSPTFKPKGKPR